MSEDDNSVLIVDRLPLVNDLRVIVHPLKLGQLKLKNGSIVEIKSVDSGKTIYAPIYAATSNDYNEGDIGNTNDLTPRFGFIQISRCLRINLNCYLGQQVTVQKADRDMIDSAECVVIAPIEDTISLSESNGDSPNTISGTYSDILFQFNLKNLPLKKNQVIPIYALNRIIEFKVVIAQPTNVVIIDDTDVIAIRNTTVPRGNSPHFDDISYDDIGGLNPTIRKIRQVIELPLLQPKLYRSIIKNLGNSKNMNVKGLLITASSGCGKTLISKAIQNETPAYFLRIDCFELLTKTVEQAIAFLLKSIEEAVSKQPSIVYFDDFDSVALPEINENAQPDSRISNALCSALKRLRAEKGVIVIAAARDDSRIRKDIKAKFDRKVNIMYPIGEERVSILRTIAVRHPIDLSLALDASSILLSGKSSAQITNSVMRMISKSIAELSFQIKAEKKNKKNKKKGKKSDSGIDDGDANADNEFSFSINQLRKVDITKNLVGSDSLNREANTKGDEDDLFEDVSFDSPDKFKPLTSNDDSNKEDNNEDYSANSRRIKPYDPEFEFYFNPVAPIRSKSKKGSASPDFQYDVIDLFGGEPMYNEGISDESSNKKRYTYDDEGDDYNSDDGRRNAKPKKAGAKGNTKKGGKKNQKGRGKGRNRRDDYDYYDDYYYDDDDYYYDDYYYDDDDFDKNKNKNTKTKAKNNKPKGKGRDRYNDDYYSDDGDTRDRNRNNSKAQNKAQNAKAVKQNSRRIDPFAERGNEYDDEPPANNLPQRNKTAPRNNRNDDQPPRGKRDFVDPFGQRSRNAQQSPQMPTKKGGNAGGFKMANPFERNRGGAPDDSMTRRKREREFEKEPEDDIDELEDSSPSPFKSDVSEEILEAESSNQIPPQQEPEPEPEPEQRQEPPPQKRQQPIDGPTRRRRNPFGKAFSRGEDDSDDDDGQFGNVERKDPFASQLSNDDDDQNRKNSSKKKVNNEEANDDNESGARQPQKNKAQPPQRTPFAENDEEEDNGDRRKQQQAKKNSRKRQADFDEEDDNFNRNRNRDRNRKQFDDDEDDSSDVPQQPQRRKMPRKKNPFE